MKKVLITWGFDENGERYLDNYLEIPQLDIADYLLGNNKNSCYQNIINSVSCISFRSRIQRTKICLFVVDDSICREDIEKFVLTADLKRLQEARIRI